MVGRENLTISSYFKSKSPIFLILLWNHKIVITELDMDRSLDKERLISWNC